LAGTKLKASEILIRHVEGIGGGFELDDFISYRATPLEQEKAVEPLMRIHEQFRSAAYPIGTLNPEAQPAIRQLARNLASEGL